MYLFTISPASIEVIFTRFLIREYIRSTHFTSPLKLPLGPWNSLRLSQSGLHHPSIPPTRLSWNPLKATLVGAPSLNLFADLFFLPCKCDENFRDGSCIQSIFSGESAPHPRVGQCDPSDFGPKGPSSLSRRELWRISRIYVSRVIIWQLLQCLWMVRVN